MEAGEKRRVRAAKSKKTGGKAAQVRSAEEEARRKELLRETLREKLELERRALQVVERLLEDDVTEDFLTDCVRLITPANYRDVVEERSIAKLCGYPVCSSKLTNVPSQQFKISTKTNKVYDITERKCFCSNFCFKASKFLEVQISKSPLWLRKEEKPADVNLMTKGDGGSSGQEVKLSDRPVNVSDVENPVPESFGPRRSSSESEESDEEQGFVSSVVSRERPRPRVHWGKLPKRHDQDPINTSVSDTSGLSRTPQPDGNQDGGSTLISNDAPLERSVEETRKLLDQCDVSNQPGSTKEVEEVNVNNDATESSLRISQVSMSKKGAAGLQHLLKNLKKSARDPPVVTRSLLEALRHTLMEWRTEETMRFLYGQDYKWQTEAVPDSDEEEDELDEDDLEDPEQVTEKKKVSESQVCPPAAAPDYESLRTETKMMEVRVQEFYRGVCVLPEEVECGTVGEGKGAENVPLPLVDSQAQHAIQKHIAVERICRSLRDVTGPLGVTMSEIINDLNNLVRTFRFTNVNIIHKPPEWTLISIVLLTALAEVSPTLRQSMVKASSVEYVSSLMKELRLKDEDLQSLVLLFKPDGKAHSTEGKVEAAELRGRV